MVLDANTQVGDRYSESETNIHVFEFHSKTAAWGLGLIIFIALMAGGLWWFCRRKFAAKRERDTRQLVMAYRKCTCEHKPSILTRDDAEVGVGPGQSLSRY
jgi:hypothetical protein